MSNDFRSSEWRSRIMNMWNHNLTRIWLQFQNFKCNLLAFWTFSKLLKIWKSELDLTNVTGTSYHWCHLITDVNDEIMDQLSNESTKLLNILFKNLVSNRILYSTVCSTTVEKLRHSVTPCLISLFDTGASNMWKSSLLMQ